MFENRIQEAPAWCVVPLVFSALVSIGLFFYPQPFFRLAQMAVKGITGGLM
jgi:multicomponent Na+:H+ antiporter subunit D